MMNPNWAKEFPGAITVCDEAGRILAMNDRSVESFASDGGAALVGTNVLDCHPEPSRTKLEELFRTGRTNVYTIEKGGKKKLIFQAPWSREGIFAGLVELSLEIPFDMPHFVRDKP
jgi:transcriptional regulator with PAS, ATPase and Fis domain